MMVRGACNRWVVPSVAAAAFACGIGAHRAIGDGQEHARGGGADMDAMMQKWMAYATPGEEHAELASMAGQWDVMGEHWAYPGAPKEVMEMEAEGEMILGGRYLMEHISGMMDMGEGQMVPFKGMSISGYDNVTGEHFSVWFDNMGTGLWLSTGQEEGDGVLIAHGTHTDPMRGGKVEHKVRSEKHEDGSASMVFWNEMPDGSMHKVMRLVYSRDDD